MALTSTIPATVLEKLIPIIMKQLDQLTNISSLLSNALNSLPTNVKCNDPRINDIKQKLKDVKKLTDNLNLIRPKLQSIVTTLNIISVSADIVKMIQMVIPAFTGVPQVPFAMIAKTVDELGKNCKSANAALNTINNVLNSSVSGIDNVLAQAVIKLSLTCVNETFPVSSRVSNLINKKSSGGTVADSDGNLLTNVDTGSLAIDMGVDPNQLNTNNLNIVGTDPNNQYLSFFYNAENVSDTDLQLLNTLVNDLETTKRTVQKNIIEMPSNIITSTVAGETPKPKDGTISDFYVNTADQLIWGPKPSDNNWDDIVPINY
jgi:hypothetical protein